MKARLLTKWGEYPAGSVIEHAETLGIPSYAATFHDDDAEVESLAPAVPESDDATPKE